MLSRMLSCMARATSADPLQSLYNVWRPQQRERGRVRRGAQGGPEASISAQRYQRAWSPPAKQPCQRIHTMHARLCTLHPLGRTLTGCPLPLEAWEVASDQAEDQLALFARNAEGHLAIQMPRPLRSVPTHVTGRGEVSDSFIAFVASRHITTVHGVGVAAAFS